MPFTRFLHWVMPTAPVLPAQTSTCPTRLLRTLSPCEMGREIPSRARKLPSGREVCWTQPLPMRTPTCRDTSRHAPHLTVPPARETLPKGGLRIAWSSGCFDKPVFSSTLKSKNKKSCFHPAEVHQLLRTGCYEQFNYPERA